MGSLRTGALCFGLVVAMLIAPAPAGAASITIAPATAQPGSVVRLAGSGFAAGATGVVAVGSARPLVVSSDRDGRLRRALTMPAGARTGRRAVVVVVGDDRVTGALSLARRARPLSALGVLATGEQVLLSRTRGTVGVRLRVRGRGFVPGARVTMQLGARAFGSARVDVAGRFSTLVRVPRSTPRRTFVIARAGSVRLALSFRVTRTAPAAAPSPSAPLTPTASGPDLMPSVAAPVIAAAGDIACAPGDSDYQGGSGTATACRHGAVSDLLLTTPLAAVLPLGDLQYEKGGLDHFRASYAPTWGRLDAIARPVPGNHEYGTADAAGYFTYFGAVAGPGPGGYYSYDIGAWHLIALNSNCGAVSCGAGSPQERWLRADLAAHPVPCTLAYWHHPRFSSGDHGDSAATAALWQALFEAGADVVLNGHDHDYERFAPQTPDATSDPTRGIREFVVGTGGKGHRPFRASRPNSEVRDAKAFGALLLTLRPGGYDWRFAAVPGQAFTDVGAQDCHG